MIVACVWVKGNVDYSSEYVFRLRSMVARRLDRKHEFVCLTDRPEELSRLSGTAIRVPSPQGIPGWWSKLELFNPKHGLRGPGVYFDLDVLLVSRSLEPIADYDAPMALIPHAGEWNGRGGLRVVKRYNSSVIKMAEMGAHAELWRRWSPAVAGQLWGDQDWIGYMMPNEATMPIGWFPRISQLDMSKGRSGLPGDARVVLCKKPKNHEAAKRFSWIDAEWC